MGKLLEDDLIQNDIAIRVTHVNAPAVDTPSNERLLLEKGIILSENIEKLNRESGGCII